jgi:hypothetical protein
MNTTVVIPVYQALRIRAYIHTNKFADWIFSLTNAWREEIYAEMDSMFLSVGEHRGVGLTRGIVDLEDGSIRDFVDIVVRHPLLYQAILEFSGIISRM